MLDPCRGGGAFWRHMPGAEWCEAAEGRDFFAWTEPVDWIVSNPPYSTFKPWMLHSFTLATLVQLDPIYVAFAPSDSDITEIQTRRAAGPLALTILNPADGKPLATGLLDFVNNAVDASTSTIIMRGSAPNPNKLLIPGQFVRVRLDLGVRDGALVVPQRAIASDQTGKSLAFVTDENRVEFRPVKLGVTVGTQFQVIDSGLNPGDRIVVEAVQKLVPGMPVQPIPVPAQAPAQAPAQQ